MLPPSLSARLEPQKSGTRYEHYQQCQKHVGRIGIDVPDMHPPDDRCNAAQGVHGRLQDKPVDDVDLGVLSPDRRPEVPGHRLRTVFNSSRPEQDLENDPNRV